MTLAIVASTFVAPSETFIRNHVRTIAPDETVLLCNDARRPEQFDGPVLTDMSPSRPAGDFKARVVNAAERRWRTYVDPSFHLLRRRRVRDFLQAHGVECVLAEYGPTGLALADLCDEVGIPLFVHFHGYDASIPARDPIWRKAYRRMFRTVAGVIAPSQFLADQIALLGCPRDKLHVAPCGVDADTFRPAARDPNTLLAVGRLVEKKAPHLTIASFGRISERYPAATLDVVGDGPLMARCQTLVTELKLGDKVRLHGARPPEFVAKLMSEASVFVQHSVTTEGGDTEGLPVALLEAMASAVPVVATRHSGIPEAVEDGATGMLVAEHDVGGMAESIATLLNAPAWAAEMGARGRQRVLERFTLEKTAQKLRDVLQLEAPGAGVPGAGYPKVHAEL